MSQEALYTKLEQDEFELDTQKEAFMTAKTWRRRFFTSLGLFSLTMIALVIVYLFPIGPTHSCECLSRKLKMPYSPAEGHVEYVNKRLTADPDTPKFIGKPRKELDDAWHDLLQGTLIRVSGEELLKANNATSVAHREGGYVAGLGISHSLHCLKRIKQYMHRDYYYTGEQDWYELEGHVDHCMESLRQLVLCQADLSLYTLQWTPHSRLKPAVRVPQAHTCVDWSGLHQWMLGRAARFDDMEAPPAELYLDMEDQE